MPTFLADPPQAVIVLLVAGLLVTGLIWMNRRGRKVAIAFLVLLALTCLVVLVDRLFESPREEAVRRVQAMVAAADHHDPDAFVAHVADTVEYKGESQDAGQVHPRSASSSSILESATAIQRSRGGLGLLARRCDLSRQAISRSWFPGEGRSRWEAVSDVLREPTFQRKPTGN